MGPKVKSWDNVSSSSPLKVASSFLKGFLAKKRVPEVEPPPPPEEPWSDDYLRAFSENFIADRGDSDAKAELDPDETVALIGRDALNVEVSTVNILAEPGQRKRPRDDADTGSDKDGEESETEVKEVVNLNVKLFNLPFKMSVNEMKHKIREKKVGFTELVLDMDKTRGIPAGTAVLTLASAVDFSACFEKLKDVEWQGRPLRVVSMDSSGRGSGRGAKGAPRYYLNGDNGGITKKCCKCGQLGHVMRDCINPPLPFPCHLCAGTDHEAQMCPNITCYKCGQFGHHAKDCRGRRVEMTNGTTVALCSQCGQVGHASTHCDYPAVEAVSVMNGAMSAQAACCMKCGDFGHVICRPMPGLESRKHSSLYCPNCGKGEHHSDYCQPSSSTGSSSSKAKAGQRKGEDKDKDKDKSKSKGKGKDADSDTSSVCTMPRQEAYNRFPELLHNLDSMPKSAAERNIFYTRLCRQLGWDSDGAGALQLFPSLARAQGGGGGEGRNSRGGGGGGGGGGGSAGGSGSHRRFGDLSGLEEFMFDDIHVRDGGGRHSNGGQRGRDVHKQRHSTGSFTQARNTNHNGHSQQHYQQPQHQHFHDSGRMRGQGQGREQARHSYSGGKHAQAKKFSQWRPGGDEPDRKRKRS